jgi:hypothetical protein
VQELGRRYRRRGAPLIAHELETGTSALASRARPRLPGQQGAFPGCLASRGIHEAVTYQPGSRHWPFQ